MKKLTKEFHPELANLAEGKVNDLIAEAQEASKADVAAAKAEPDKEMAQ